jgi:DNA-binding transcriptional MerR regulator
MQSGRIGTKSQRRLGSTTAAAAEHGVSPRTIRRWVKDGGITSRMVSGSLLIDLDSVSRKRYQRQEASRG